MAEGKRVGGGDDDDGKTEGGAFSDFLLRRRGK